MSTVRVTITVEVDGPLGQAERPAMQQWKFIHNAWDNPQRYQAEVAQAVAEASARVVGTLHTS